MEHRRSWKLAALFAVAAIVSAGAAVVVGGAAAASSHSSHHNGAQASAVSTGTPATARVMQVLYAGHAKDMQAWRDKYAADPTGAEATRALQRLRKEHHQDRIAAFARLGIKSSAQSCEAAAGSMMDGSAGGMMGGSSAPGMMDGASVGGSHAQHHSSGSGAAGAGGPLESTVHRDMMGTVTS